MKIRSVRRKQRLTGDRSDRTASANRGRVILMENFERLAVDHRQEQSSHLGAEDDRHACLGGTVSDEDVQLAS